MASFGIDVGSDSIRLCVKSDDKQFFAERPLQRQVDGVRHTMRSSEVWARIEEMIEESRVQVGTASSQAQEGVCVAATCSMAVMEKIHIDGVAHYRPLDDIIVWMDGRASENARWVNERMNKASLAQVGGQVTPEMGIAKLKWVDVQYRDKDVYVFELYDWISYLFMAGGMARDGTVLCLENDVEEYEDGSSAMDGSVKGWGRDVLEVLDIRAKVACAPDSVGNEQRRGKSRNMTRIPSAGSVLGRSVALVKGAVHHGCIDCYGVVLEEVRRDTGKHSLSMVAGTSTCFIAMVPQAEGSIDGTWGPFEHLGNTPVYSFGQPATGMLFAPFFAGCTAEEMERRARELENRHGRTLAELAKNHLYYGDKGGNRSPYGDFTMDEVSVSGTNADESCGTSVWTGPEEDKVLRYYLTMEFLVFQTKQLVERVAAVVGRPFEVVYAHGSQAANKRMMRMLKHFAFGGNTVQVARTQHSKYAGAQGCCRAVEGTCGSEWDEFECEDLTTEETFVLQRKFHAFIELAEWQHRFRVAMG